MSGPIPSEFIDELLARVDIVDVINSRITLQKAGAEYKACCPFHGEKTPSFTVSPSKQFYHCFGCGAHGSALGFLMEYDHVSFPEAVETLANNLGMALPKLASDPKADSNRPIYAAMESAQQFFQGALRQAEANAARDYLSHRGLSESVIEDFGIGFAPDGFQGLLEALSKQHQPHILKQAGLIKTSDTGRQYDAFRNRITFPIRDRRGRVVAFGGRVLDDSTPKYLNSPETPIYTKGREIYGLFEARKKVRNLNQLIVVEGYMDVIALAQAGIENAVAALGTAATSYQIETLFRGVPEVTFCFDGDRAGRDAAWRALENSLPVLRAGREAKFLFLADGEDPDSLVRQQGANAFRAQLEHALALSHYLFEHISLGVDENSADGKARVADRAKPLIERVKDPVLHALLSNELSDRIGLSGAQLKTALQLSNPASERRARPSSIDPHRNPVRMAIALLLQQPDLAQRVENASDLLAHDQKGIDLLVALLERARDAGTISGARLIESHRDTPAYAALAQLLNWNPNLDEAALTLSFDDTIHGLLTRATKERIAKLSRQPTLSDAETAELRRLLKQRSSAPP